MRKKTNLASLEKIVVLRFEEKNGFYTSPEQSKKMSGVRAKHTLPELRLRKALWAAGIRYRTHSKQLPGRPDISIQKYKLAIFIDGGFWHGYEWEKRKPRMKSNRGFWIPKIERNMQRDQENNRSLENFGYTVLRFWDHEVKKDLGRCLKAVLDHINALQMPWGDLEA